MRYNKGMKKFGLLAALVILAPLFSTSAQEVDIIWQGETYTPPFYEGRALWSKQSLITLVAIPQGLGNPSNLIYKWIQDGTVLGFISGPGKDTLRIEDSLFSKPQTIKVEIVTAEDELLADDELVIVPTNSQALIYEKNPLYGYMFHREVGRNFRIDEGEVTFSAFPFFSTPPARDAGNLTYQWSTNTGESGVGHTVTYRAPEEGEGTSRVGLRISNTAKILLPFSREFLVQFGEE